MKGEVALTLRENYVRYTKTRNYDAETDMLFLFKRITVERINDNANAKTARLAESPQRGPVETKIPAFLPTTDEAPNKRIPF